MAIFFTSDLHFGHENILTHCNRPFDNVTEMNEMLIRNWNRKVGNEDEVYIIVDLAFRSGRPVKEYLDRLNGRKHFIIGNHDLWLKNFPSASEYFLSVDHMRVIEMNSMRITLCHYPLFEWSGSRRALQQDKSKSWLIHGHLHNRTEADAFRNIKAKLPCALNAGVDINHFEPVTFSELISNNNAWYGRDPCLTDINQGQTNPKEIGNNLKKIRKEIQRREQKLANNAFLTHAPVHIVDGEREKLEKARSYEKCLEKELDVLQSSSDKHYEAYRDWYFCQQAMKLPPHNHSWMSVIPEMHKRRAPGNTCLSALRTGEPGDTESRSISARAAAGSCGWLPLHCGIRESVRSKK